MPILINEIVIRATIVENPKTNSSQVPEFDSPEIPSFGNGDDEIIEKVLEILKSKQER